MPESIHQGGDQQLHFPCWAVPEDLEHHRDELSASKFHRLQAGGFLTCLPARKFPWQSDFSPQACWWCRTNIRVCTVIRHLGRFQGWLTILKGSFNINVVCRERFIGRRSPLHFPCLASSRTFGCTLPLEVGAEKVYFMLRILGSKHCFQAFCQNGLGDAKILWCSYNAAITN